MNKFFIIFITLLSMCIGLFSNTQTFALTLEQAQIYAVINAPEIKQLQSQSKAFLQTSISKNAFDDPKMSVGLANLPTDDFSFTQSEMTQIQIGLMQQLPKGHTLSILSEQEKLKSSTTDAQIELTKLEILKTIREQWLSLYYWKLSLHIYEKEKKLFLQLSKTTKSALSNNQIQQKDYIRSKLELSQVKQNILYVKQKISAIDGQLSRWLNLKNEDLSLSLPHWAIPQPEEYMSKNLKNHPLLKIDQLQSDVGEKGIQLAEQQYYPGINVGVVYGIRQGNSMTTDQPRSNFIGAQVTFDLPFFTSNLQGPELQASEDLYVGMKAKEQADYQQLLSILKSSYANWEYLQSQDQLYQNNLVPEAEMYAKSSKIAYQNKLTDFPTLVLAYLQDYNTQLASLKTKVSLLKTRVNLLYLQGI
ncbi:MAG: outer membrane protein TolC [Francisellaceae bacterium]|jgi:outer membrane protein TolC